MKTFRTINQPEHPQAPLIAIIATILFFIVLFLASCTTTKYVPVVSTEKIEHTIHDTIATRDTLINNTTTIIKELDSLQMAQYGIQLASQQRAWLIDRQSLQQQISTLQQSHAEAIHDTITKPVPYEVTKEVPAELSKWQSFRMTLGDILMICVGGIVIYIIYRLYRKLR